MLINYFITSWRNLVNNKVYSILNILGLAIGMAVALLIGLWVHYQYSYDRFLPDYQHSYQVRYKLLNNGQIETQASACLPLATAIRKDVPGVKYVVQTQETTAGLMAGDNKIYIDGMVTGEDFLKMFQYAFLQGNANTALTDPYSIVLTEATAQSLFGKQDPLNKTVRFEDAHDLKVTGVLKNVPGNSTLQFGFIVPFSYYMQSNDYIKRASTDWGDNSYGIFVALQQNVSYGQIEPTLSGLLRKYAPNIYNQSKAAIFLHPMKDWQLFSEFKNGIASGGFISYVRMFSIIGILVLLIACINFINFATARSDRRAKEVGIRKTMGSLRKHLILQFLVESITITFISFGFALFFVYIVLPYFNTLAETTLSIPFGNPVFWLMMLGLILITGLLAGSKPAFYLSSFQPVKVLKSGLKAGGGKSTSLSRKTLVVLQFSCSIALIISTIIIYQQISYAKDRPVGYDINRLMMTDNSGDLSQHYPALKNELLKSGLVTNVTKASSSATNINSRVYVDDWQGKLPGETLGGMGTIAVSDADYFSTLGMQLIEGRNFTGNKEADSGKIILNEAAVQRLRFKEPLHQKISWGMGKAEVIGVVKDALMLSPFSPAEPTFFLYEPGWDNNVLYRLSPSVNVQDAITKLSAIFNKINPAYPYLYNFADESYAAKFKLEVLIGRLAGIFSLLAIFISCLGLYGLTAYMAEQRSKEIAIRKVLGASLSQLCLLLSKDFLALVLVSCLIASPIAFYFLQHWLDQYSYRIHIGPIAFVLSSMAAIVITLITISFQAIRTAIANPVKNLKAE